MIGRGLSIAVLALSVVSMVPQTVLQQNSQAQNVTTRPAFEVASVRISKNPTPAMRFQPQPGGRFVAENVPLRFLIMTAYDLPPSRISGGPDFMGERYDIQAKAPEGPDADDGSSPDIFKPGQLTRARLQDLLETRFQLKYHWVTEQRRISALMVNKEKPSIPRTQEESCVVSNTQVESSPKAGEKPNCGFQRIGYDGVMRTLEMKGVTVEEFASVLTTAEVPGLIDRTGLTGTFDISLRWAHCPMSESSVSADPDTPPPAALDCGGPSLSTALKEQLGLKVEPATGPVRVMVIDHFEKPSEN